MSRNLLRVCRFYFFEIEIYCSFLRMVGIERVIKKIIIFCRCHKWMTPYLPDINKSHLPFTSTEQSGDCPTQLSKTFFLEKTKCKECVNSSAKLSFCFVFLLCSFCWQLKMVIKIIAMIWFPLLLDFSFFGNPPLYFLYGRGIAYYECINTWIIFEWTYDLLLVISSWAWLYSIKADRTTQLHFYKTADDFTTTANLKAHTLNRWQTCYLNWKFNTFSILDIDFKFFLKWN